MIVIHVPRMAAVNRMMGTTLLLGSVIAPLRRFALARLFKLQSGSLTFGK